jgi:hypothetical protein
MIRIDEIYNHTFWPWLEQNRPGTRMFFCDPPGHTGPEHLFNLGRDDVIETDYVFFHDQEPVDSTLYHSLFDTVIQRNTDIFCKPQGHVVVSERGQNVDELNLKYGWKSHYYFYHGWACMDWFRGYDKTFLIPRAEDRNPTQTFMSPNRIIAGQRDHRVLFLYNIFKHNLEHNHISAPRICTVENVDISTVARKYCNIYPDIEQIFNDANLPRLFQGEQTQQMTSCWLSNFAEAQDSLFYVPTETIYFGRRTHITEKTFKAIALEMPFILVAPAGSLEYLREYGFQTFNTVIDESYDEEPDDIVRIEKITKLLQDLNNLSGQEKHSIHQACLPIVEHNYNHFYKGAFADILWKELTNMLKELSV